MSDEKRLRKAAYDKAYRERRASHRRALRKAYLPIQRKTARAKRRAFRKANPLPTKLTKVERKAHERASWIKYGRNNKATRARYYAKNRSKVLSQKQGYYERHRKRIIKKNNDYQSRRRRIDPVFRMHCTALTRVSQFFTDRCAKTATILGCKLPVLKAHLESYFTGGMSWANYGRRGWHMDHYVPLKSIFDWEQPDHQLLAFSYLNLRPLWGSANTIKSNQMPTDAMAHLQSIAAARGIDFEAHRKYFTSRLDKFRKVVK